MGKFTHLRAVPRWNLGWHGRYRHRMRRQSRLIGLRPGKGCGHAVAESSIRKAPPEFCETGDRPSNHHTCKFTYKRTHAFAHLPTSTNAHSRYSPICPEETGGWDERVPFESAGVGWLGTPSSWSFTRIKILPNEQNQLTKIIIVAACIIALITVHRWNSKIFVTYCRFSLHIETPEEWGIELACFFAFLDQKKYVSIF